MFSPSPLPLHHRHPAALKQGRHPVAVNRSERVHPGFFVFIHLNGAVDAPELLADACQAWSPLKTGGILILGNVDRGGGEQSSAYSRAGADAFLDVFSGRLDRLFEGRRVAVMKRA